MRYVIALAVVLALALIPLGTGSAQQRTAWVANLSGAEEVPPVNTQATGRVTFELNAQRTSMTYYAFVNNINNVMMGHIHAGAPGQNGAIAVWLYPAAPPPVLRPGITTDVLATGTITAANLTGPLQGHPFTDLINLLDSGGAYANFHTQQFGGGEIRGQIR
jgi:CHRD domain-containing protein